MRYRRLPTTRPTPRGLQEPISPRKKCVIWTRWRPVPVIVFFVGIYANSLKDLKRFEEAKELLRKVTPVARRVLGNSNEITLTMRSWYAISLFMADDATLDDLREALNTLEEIEPTARRVFGGAHPLTLAIEKYLQSARAALRISLRAL